MPIVKIPKVLLPNNKVDLSKWAVVACDQYTSDREYWNNLSESVGDKESTLNLIFPEVYLNDGDFSSRVKKINDTMDKYVSQGIFNEIYGIILVERHLKNAVRYGLMLQINLDCYEWATVNVPIRATEDTILSRLPVRREIRKDAKIELPHSIVLIDDEKKEIIESLVAKKHTFKKLYDFDLNMGGGNVKGYLVDEPEKTIEKLMLLLNKERQIKKYGYDAGILFAVGDGNHSIATAKTIWDGIKSALNEEERANHPAGYALTEVVNIYGDGMDFEPIHRAIWGCDDGFINRLQASVSGEGKVTVLTIDGEKTICVPEDSATAIKQIQSFIEDESAIGKIKVDYIHEESALRDLVKSSGCMGILMPRFDNSKLFGYVVNVGNLPKKAFSIGEANEKRYYLEAKYIK